MSRREYKRWARAQRRGYYDADQPFAARPVEDRIIAFRRTLFQSAAVLTMLGTINAVVSPTSRGSSFRPLGW